MNRWVQTVRSPAIAIVASLAAFWGAAAMLDPALVRRLRTGDVADPERAEVFDALFTFQKIWEDFFATGGAPALIDEFPATKPVKHRVFRDVGFLRNAALVQVQDLATATPISLRWVGPDAVDAVLYEEWNVVFQRAVDRKPVSSVKGTGRGFRYRLVRDRGGWKVASWRSEEVAAPERPPEFAY